MICFANLHTIIFSMKVCYLEKKGEKCFFFFFARPRDKENLFSPAHFSNVHSILELGQVEARSLDSIKTFYMSSKTQLLKPLPIVPIIH